MDDLETLIICSTRYAVGRKTYITWDIATIILKNIDTLSRNCLLILNRDIEREIERGNYGMECDLHIWNDVVHELKKRIEND